MMAKSSRGQEAFERRKAERKTLQKSKPCFAFGRGTCPKKAEDCSYGHFIPAHEVSAPPPARTAPAAPSTTILLYGTQYERLCPSPCLSDYNCNDLRLPPVEREACLRASDPPVPLCADIIGTHPGWGEVAVGRSRACARVYEAPYLPPHVGPAHYSLPWLCARSLAPLLAVSRIRTVAPCHKSGLRAGTLSCL